MVISIDLDEILQIIQEANDRIAGLNFYLEIPIVNEIKELNEDVIITKLIENSCPEMANEIFHFTRSITSILIELAYRIRLLCSKDLLDIDLCEHIEYIIYTLKKVEPRIEYLKASAPPFVSPQLLHYPGIKSYIVDFMELRQVSGIIDELQELIREIDTKLAKVVDSFRLLEEELPLSSSLLE